MEDVCRSIGIMHKRDSSVSFLCCLLSRSSGWCEPHIVLKFVVKDSNKIPGFTLTMKKWKWKCESLSHVWLFATPWTAAHQAPPPMGFSRQEYWSGLPFPSPGDLPDPGIKSRSPALQADSLPSEPPGKPHLDHAYLQYNFKMPSNNIVKRWETRESWWERQDDG